MKWTDADILFLKENYLSKTHRELSEIFGRSISAIKKKSRRVGLSLSPDEIYKRLKYPKISIDNQDGQNNPNWKGGISKNNYHYKKIQKMRYPEKIKAREAVMTALRSGKLIKLPCEICGNIESQAHHDDYSDPLNVRWLCPLHHRQEHNIESCRGHIKK